jgi:uncharacterized lipoprotein YddW (UPF0748 family)
MMISLATLLIASSLAKDTVPTEGLPTIPREFRAAWVATVDNIDWPSRRDLTTAQQQEELRAIFLKAREMRLNAIVFQVRPSADALYKSKLEPWSEYLTGAQGKAPNPEWDPLQFAVDEAHKAGMELHCWFNPYRANHPAQKGPLASSHIGKTNPKVVKTYGKYLWMDPGEREVQKRSLDVMLDVVKRYDIDGVHIDDYFYPYPIYDENKKKIDFPDGPSWAAYQKSGGKLSRGDWRRKNVDDFIEDLYTGIKKTKKHVKFGISPFGIYRPGIPATIKAGVDQYDELYADAELWLKKGWCDYYSPQLYWPIAQTPQSYPVLLDYWLKVNDKNRHVWPGLYTSRTNPAEGNWKPEEVINQVTLSRQKQASPGNVHFSFKSLQLDHNKIGSSLKSGIYNQSAFVPETPWLGDKAPSAPRIELVSAKGSDNFESLKLSSDKGIFSYAVSFGSKQNGKIEWSPYSQYSDSMMIDVRKTSYIAAIAISRNGIASAISTIECK